MFSWSWPDDTGMIPTVLQWVQHDNALTGFIESGGSPNRIAFTGVVNGSQVQINYTFLVSVAAVGTLSDGTLTLDFPHGHLIFHPASESDYNQAVRTTTTTTQAPLSPSSGSPAAYQKGLSVGKQFRATEGQANGAAVCTSTAANNPYSPDTSDSEAFVQGCRDGFGA
jgi:hypothetical protein